MINTTILSWVYWNPSRDVFTVPYLNHPLRWYGVLFALGFIVGYWIFHEIILRRLNQENKPNAKQLATLLTDRITWFIVAGTIIGARLGHVFFYEWPNYREHPLDIFKIWEGGLASHGGLFGILAALYLYKKFVLKNLPEISYVDLLDMLCIPTAFAAVCIRLGNFINQEILGTETTLPWAVVFGDPADGSPRVPRHPVQLYEALAALLTFILLYTLWKKRPNGLRSGILSGLFFILIFGSRFFIEFLKLPSSLMLDESWLQTGQFLSIPCVILGFSLLFFGDKLKK